LKTKIFCLGIQPNISDQFVELKRENPEDSAFLKDFRSSWICNRVFLTVLG
jgi:hypothetical protein